MSPHTVKALHAATLQAATELLGSATDAQCAALDAAVKGGAAIVVEMGALPDPNYISLYLVEREGVRTRVVTQSWTREPVQ